MNKSEFKKIVDRIGEAYKDPFTEAQFEEWFLHFKEENFKTVNVAVASMIQGYKYFPVIATLKSYTKEQKRVEEEKPIPKPYVRSDDDESRHKRWMQFICWIQKMCSQGRRTWNHPKNEEEVLKLKTYFEENYLKKT